MPHVAQQHKLNLILCFVVNESGKLFTLYPVKAMFNIKMYHNK